MEGVNLGPLLNIDVPVHCETCLPPTTFCLPLLALSLLQLRRHTGSGGSVSDLMSDEGGRLVQDLAEATVAVFDC